jgi:prepilin-type N-terminal cleavage/methylation domain-containing protein
MKKLNGFNTKGFTLIELLMVILIIAILALMAITQFANYTKDSRDATLKSNLQLMRRGIQTQYGQMRLRCGIRTTAWPPVGCVDNNNITSCGTDTAPCNTTTHVPEVANQVFINAGVPDNPWSVSTASGDWNLVNSSASNTRGTCGAAENGWCYNTTTGNVWPNSQENNGDATGAEDTF